SLIPLDISATVSDVLITKSNIGSQIKSLNELPKGYSIGTSSLRRKAQLLNLRNDLQIVNLRGNVTTRLEKLRFHDELDGIVLAMAGIERLQLLEKYQSNIFIIPETEIFPAIGQGRLAAQVLNENNETVNLLKSIQDLNAVTVLSAERKLVEKLGADCNSAVGIKCKLDNDKFAMSARVLSSDGNICIEENLFGEKVNADKIADQLAETLLSRGAAQYL
nr:hydroxymethylbilane synthase [Pseudomonadota bacterium]